MEGQVKLNIIILCLTNFILMQELIETKEFTFYKNLDNNTIRFLNRELLSIHDKCYGCGGKGHFIKNCPKIKNVT